jgi:hypothetical protein
MTTSSFLDAFNSAILQMSQQISVAVELMEVWELWSTSCCVRLFRSSGGANLLASLEGGSRYFRSNESPLTPDAHLLSEFFTIARQHSAIIKEPEAPVC